MSELSRGSQITACGVVRGEPKYTRSSGGTSVLTYWLYCENPSGKSVQLWVVSYGDAARTESRELRKGSQVALLGTLQTRVVGYKEQTEVVSQQVMCWPGEKTQPSQQRFGAQAVLFGEIVESPVYTLLGELRTPFVRFGLHCPNPKGYDARLTVVHVGHMAATYGRTLAKGMNVLLTAEVRSHYYYPPAGKQHNGSPNAAARPADYILQFVTENVQAIGTGPAANASSETSPRPAHAKVNVP